MFNFEIKTTSFLPHTGCDVSFHLQQGDVILLTGENGIGKSTMLQHLREKFSSKFQISLIEQKPLDLFYDRNLGDIKGALLSSRPEIDSLLFDRLWNGFGLNRKEDRSLSQISGGESQALKLCCGLVSRSEIFFLDEASQFLDENKKAFLLETISTFKTMKKSFLIVEHDLAWLPKEWRILTLVKFNNQTIGFI